MASAIHKAVRDNVLSVWEAAVLAAYPLHTVSIFRALDTQDGRLINKPGFIVSYGGTEYPTGSGTNERDDFTFPILVAYYSTMPNTPTDDPPGGLAITQVRELGRITFNWKRSLTDVTSLMQTVYDGQEPPFDTTSDGFKDLQTAFMVNAECRVSRN